jgi:5-methylcytosine-specific restriction endonuclease McrA
MSKLERIRSIASHRLPINASFEELVEFLADYFNEREDPAVRRERREKRKAVSQDASDRANRDVAHAGSRGVPARVRDEVFIRDQGRCAYVGANGRRCGSTHVLQVDHIKPVARGGASTPDNLRLLCAHHNRLEAERLMGRSGPRDGPMH